MSDSLAPKRYRSTVFAHSDIDRMLDSVEMDLRAYAPDARPDFMESLARRLTDRARELRTEERQGP